ncbi:MAG: HigA family addiction module antitoxin [Nitrospirota bacterium]
MAMHNPAHPGEVLKGLRLEPMGMSVTEAAEHLGVARKTVSKIINGRGAITPEMALRLEIVFGSTAETWMNMQTAYGLWQMAEVRKRLRRTLHRIVKAAAAN